MPVLSPKARKLSRSLCESGGCASLSSEMRGFCSVPATSTLMIVAFAAVFTWYSAVTCSVGFRSGVPMNNAEPRVMLKRRLR